MKPIPLPTAELKTALTGISKIIQRRPTLPVLGFVKIERNSEGWIALTATDLDRFATVRLEQPAVGEPASLLLPYEELLKTSKACGNGDTMAVHSEENASEWSGIISYPISGQLVAHRCASLKVEEFPSIPRIKGDSLTLPENVRSSILDAFECASTDETRYILNGAYLDVSQEDGHYVVATDGRQLYSSNSFKLPCKESVIIPTHKFLEWREFNRDGDWQLRTASAEKKGEHPWLQITSRRWRFITRQIEGSYPNWRQTVPSATSWNARFELEESTLGEVCQLIDRLPCTDLINLPIRIEVKDTKVTLIAEAPGADQPIRVELKQAKAIGNPMTLRLNRRYLIRALKLGLNTVHFIDPLEPVRLSHEGRQLILMPLRPSIAITQPAAPEAAPLERNITMPRITTPSTVPAAPPSTNGSNGHQPAAEKTSLELALEQIEATKANVRLVREGLNTLAEMLKQVHRDQKSSEKEVQSVRATLEKLQSFSMKL